MPTRNILAVNSAAEYTKFVDKSRPGVVQLAYRRDLNQLFLTDPDSGTIMPFPSANTGVQFARVRVTIAQINAGFTILPALAGLQYQIVDLIQIAIGGTPGTATAITVLGTVAAAGATLFSTTVATLTQSARILVNTAGVTALADGASFVPLDANTAVTVGKTGGTADTATNIDFLISYVLIG